MGYARYIGRVGALAVALGVGLAIASTPPIAYAEPSDSSSSTSDSSSTSKSSSSTSASSSTSTSSSTKTASTGSEPTSTNRSDGTDSSPSKPESPSGSTDGSGADTDAPADDDTADDVTEEADGVEPTNGEDAEETPPAGSDEDTPSADPASEKGDVTVEDSASDDSADQRASSGHGSRAPKADTDVASSVTATVGQPTPSGGEQSQMRSTAAIADTPTTYSSARSFTTAATTFTAAALAADSAPAEPQQHPTIVSVVTDFVAAVLQPFMNPGSGLSFPASLLVGVLSAVGNEIERLLRRTAPVASQYTVSQIAGPSLLADLTPNVLLIGVDGTNLSRILADDENDNFFALMDDGTTAASSIVGHTTISNPSWTSILTGVWGERAGVSNNVFTPWTYDNFPTVFNQLETHNPDIDTTAIADWNVINAISGAGSIPVDTNIYIPQFAGDTDWSQTDDAVGDATVDAIANTATGTPSFLFSYFVGVDENGHMHGGASPEYAEAIRNVDENLGEILTAVDAWETAHPGEGEWTIIVVTDHGHQPQQGFGHGFQTPDETATFVIASGPDFNDGFVNPDYEIVDTTPTVLTLFGAPPPAYFDGVSLTTLGGSDEDPGPGNLHQALKEMIATNHDPGIFVSVPLSLRTIFATIPYYVWTLTNDGTLPIPILGNVLYVVTNVPAQIVAWLTGVTGARIFPLLPPGPPSWPGQEEETAPDSLILACGGPSGSAAEASCDASNVA